MRISIKHYVLCIMRMSFGPKRLLKLLTFLSLTTYYLLHTTPVHADVKIGDQFGFGNITSLGEAFSKLVMPVFSAAAAMVVLYFLFGAFKYLQSRGDKEEVAAAQQIIIHSVIGFIILMGAFFILQFFLSSLFGITGLEIIKT